MSLLNLRDLVAFPQNGDNSSDIVLNGVHFNLTALNKWNYTLYSNNTISNYSNCYLIFDQFKPIVLSNGSFVNATSCYVPILSMKTRSHLALVFTCLFGLGLFFTLINLRKHGQQFLREDSRFRIIGRRWQWYWLIIMSTCGIISCVTGVDVDRDYLQDLAIILQSFFFVLTGVTAVCAVWEAVRHWTSWLERQAVDRDPYGLPVNESRSKAEFYMPLVFYLFSFMSFFLTVPRSWSQISKQRDPIQQATVAKPQALDARFKAGHFFLVSSLAVILYCLRHAIHYYKPSQRGALNRLHTYLRATPAKLPIIILIACVRIGYGIAMTFVWDITLLKYNVDPIWPYLLGYTPCALLLLVFNIYGFIDENEDKIIIRQRIHRDRLADTELGINKKPTWWSKVRGDGHLSDMERLRRVVDDANITSLPGDNSSRGNRARLSRGPSSGMPDPDQVLELDDFPSPTQRSHGSWSESDSSGRRGSQTVRSMIDDALSPRSELLSPTGIERPWVSRQPSLQSTNSLGSELTGRTLTSENAKPQAVRSMLDI